VRTLEARSKKDARGQAAALLKGLGISARAITSAWRVLDSKRAMRGAALVHSTDGRRMEPDRRRGVRATLLGLTPRARAVLMRKLEKQGIGTETVTEALTLATKVASAKGVLAELCASDDPHYTTGYLSAPGTGYIRLPSIKARGLARGGRVIFLSPDADTAKVIKHLEETPVLVSSTGTVEGTITLEAVF
jgi:6-carboxyhexanoate--CoA ligase